MASTLAPAHAAGHPVALPTPRTGGASTSLLVFFGLMIGLLAQAGPLLNDPDSQWHMAVGRWIVSNRALPWTDLFSHTFLGRPWIAKEWASQVLFYVAYAGGGWWGVSALTAVVTAASLAGLHLWLSRRVSSTVALAVVIVVYLVLMPHLLARPHVFTVPILLVWMAGLVAALERGAAPSWWLALAMTAWANLHGSYPIGLVLAGILAGEGVLAAPRADRLRRAWDWGLFLGLATLAACATPYGYRPFLVNLGLFGSGESLRYIAEWQPLGWDGIGAIALAAFAGSVVLLLPRPRANLFRIGVVALLGIMMIRHARFADLFILAAPIVVAGPALLRFPGSRAEAPAAATLRDRIAVVVLALAALAVACLVAPRPNPAMTPVAALDAARARGLAGPVYNDYDFGGFLIASGVPTFIDGRSDQIFLGGFMDGLSAAITDPGAARFADLVGRYGVTWALVRKEGREVRHLDRLDGWTLLHQDDVAAVYYDPRRAP